MKMTHTPGPWEKTKVDDTGNCFVYNPDIGTVALVSLDVSGKSANAQLIAAAPDLLSALTDLVCCPVFTGKCFESDPETHKAWTLAREAINKATK